MALCSPHNEGYEMKKKCVVIFFVGMLIATAGYAFFNEFMSMPGQMMQMPMQMVQPQCECRND
jgi:hypothetical protein